jgi:hypothetical protein
MTGANQVTSKMKCRCPLSGVAVLTVAGIAMLVAFAGRLNAQAQTGSPGPLAESCGVPPASSIASGGGAWRSLPVFPPGQYPVKLPPASLLGARNDLPNLYRLGVSWGQLPEGRKWGSTASVTIAPDGTIWVADRCGNSGAGGTTCGGASAGVNPIFQFDTSGKLRKALGAGMFVSPHKLAVDKEGSPGPIPFFPHGYGYNLGAQRGIRIGSAKDGSVKSFIPDSCPYPYAAGSSLAEGVTADSEGNVYGADFLGDVRKFVKK